MRRCRRPWWTGEDEATRRRPSDAALRRRPVTRSDRPATRHRCQHRAQRAQEAGAKLRRHPPPPPSTTGLRPVVVSPDEASWSARRRPPTTTTRVFVSRDNGMAEAWARGGSPTSSAVSAIAVPIASGDIRWRFPRWTATHCPSRSPFSMCRCGARACPHLAAKAFSAM
jgi:hypothetical protein